MANNTVIYVSYDGIGDQLGQSQVLPYVEGLAKRGYPFELVSFEKPPSNPAFRGVARKGIRSTRLRYHRSPRIPATTLDMAQGTVATSLLALISKAKLVHARSYVAASLALPYCWLSRTPLLFDMRGLWPDERVEDGSWSPNGMIDRGLRKAEKQLLQRASAVTVLTNAMATHLRQAKPYPIPCGIHVIPTCVDLQLFRTDLPPKADISNQVKDTFPLVYLGAMGQRNLIEQVVQFYRHWRRVAKPSRLLVFSRDDPFVIRKLLYKYNLEHELIHHSLSRSQVASALKCGAAGIFLYRGSVGTLGISPTKLGEFLACGLPVVGNAVGDVEHLLHDDTGVILKDFSEGSMAKGAEKLFALTQHPATQEKCRLAAERWFSLDAGLDAYEAIYKHLLSGSNERSDTKWPKA